MTFLNRSSLTLSVLLVSTGIACGGSVAVASPPAVTAKPGIVIPAAKPVPILPIITPTPQVPASPWAWTKVSVTGDNAVYGRIRKQIDTAVAQGRDPEILLEKYRTAAQAAAGDPVTLFRWAYAAYVTASRQSSSAQIFDSIKGLSDPKYAVVPVPSYDFNRVRFLIAALTDPNPALVDLGRRLMGVSQDDDPVEYALAGILLDAYSPPKTVEALGLAQGLINQEPSRAEPYALVGEIYYLRWKAHHRENDGEQARQAYLQYVQLAPDSDSFKSRAVRLADAIGNKLKSASSEQKP